MPPEQWMGERGDTRSDVYSLGVVLYQMLSGHLPFNSTASNSLVRQNEIARQHIQVNATLLRYLRQDVSMTVVAIVESSLAKQPRDRYQIPGELADALAGSIGLASAKLAPHPVVQPDWLRSGGDTAHRQGRAPLIAVGGFVAMIVIASTLLMVCQAGAREPQPSPLPVTEEYSGASFGITDVAKSSAQLYSATHRSVQAHPSSQKSQGKSMPAHSSRMLTVGGEPRSRPDG